MIILSDLSDVLIGGLYDMAMLISGKFGRDAGLQCMRRVRETETDFNNLLRGKLTEEEYYHIFFKDGDFPFGADDIRSYFSEAFQLTVPGTLRAYQRIIAYPKTMSNRTKLVKGMPEIYIVSDHISERINEIKGYHPGIFRVTKGQFWSCELGQLKRDRDFFPKLLDRLGVGPDEVVFVDDSPINTEAAANSGITSITFRHSNQLEKILCHFGFEFASFVP